MIDPIPLEELEPGGVNAPRIEVENVEDFWPNSLPGASQYRYEYGNGAKLDALLINKNSNILVVTFHGALNRETVELPRYERLKTKLDFPVNSMYFSDPSLWLDDTLQLSWFTGWKGQDVIGQCAHWITRTAQKLSVTRIIVSGSSGGGFAALQVAARIPGSIALPFNPQTEIADYYVENNPAYYGPVRRYVQVVHPEVATENLSNISPGSRWGEALGAEISAVKTYSKGLENYVMYCHSPNDWLYELHYVPFLLAAARGDNLQRMRVYEYTDKPGHYPPQLDEFRRALQAALDWKIHH